MTVLRTAFACLLLVVWPTTLSAETDVVLWDAEPVTEVRGRDGGIREMLVDLTDPGVAGPAYTVVGRVRYEGIEGRGHLEMWSWFGDEERYFTRTLGDYGPMAALEGSSDWREFQLPFQLDATKDPTRITVAVVLPGNGRVDVQLERLVQLDAPGFIGAPSSWPIGGLLGAIAGALIGVIGATIGILTGIGRARALVDLLARVWVGLGAIATGVGVWALATGQPYDVWYPLLLVGVLSVGLGIPTIPRIRARFDALELQRMRAMDQPG